MATRYRSGFAKMGQDARQLLVARVAKLGKDAIKWAFEQGYQSRPRYIGNISYYRWLGRKGKSQSKAWDDITYNLRDSIGSAVYINGELQETTISFLNDTPMGKRTRDAIDPRSGRQVLMDYFKQLHPNKGKNDITLVCVAAMYYTKFLESGTHGGHYKIKVISSAADYVRKNWEKAVDGIYKDLKIKKPASRVIRGDIKPLKDSGYYG